MSRQTAKPDTVKTLADWVARWPKASNLGFDPETREATIYSVADRTKVSSIPWKREADTLTVLAQPGRFPAQTVAAATTRYSNFRDKQNQVRAAGETQLNLAEAALLDAWRTYNAASESDRGTYRRDILTAERTLREIEATLANKGRKLLTHHFNKAYVPPMPISQRGIAPTE